jgi:WD40 repeat protein
MALSPKGHLLAWAGWQSLGILDYDSGQSYKLPLLRPYGYCNPAFFADGRELAFANATNIMVLDVRTRKLRSFATIYDPMLGLAISSNGLWLASVHAGGGLILWDCATGQQITNMSEAHPSGAYEVQFSPDSRLLASGGADGTGKIWDVVSGGLRLRHKLRGLVSPELAFSPDCRRVVSNSGDNVLKLWDTGTGLDVGTIYSHSKILRFAFTPDGSGLYCASEDGELRLWPAPSLDQLDARTKKSGPSTLSSKPVPNSK